GARHGEVELWGALISDGCCRERHVDLPVRDTGKEPLPGQDLLAELEPGPVLEQLVEVVIEPGRLAVLDELEGRVVVFRGDHHVAALLDLLERGRAGRGRGKA